MRTTLILDDDLVAKASSLTGIEEKTRLLHMGLEALIHNAASKRLQALGGTMPEFVVAGRNRQERTGDISKVGEEMGEYGTGGHLSVD